METTKHHSDVSSKDSLAPPTMQSRPSAAVPDRMFWERQAVDKDGVADRRCLKHALNNYIGKARFKDSHLIEAGEATTAMQASLLDNGSVNSDWADGDQNWSYQVLCQIGDEELGVQFESIQALQDKNVAVERIERFIVQRSDHWVAIVKSDGWYYDLNSLASAPFKIGTNLSDVKSYLPTGAMLYAAWPEPHHARGDIYRGRVSLRVPSMGHFLKRKHKKKVKRKSTKKLK